MLLATASLSQLNQSALLHFVHFDPSICSFRLPIGLQKYQTYICLESQPSFVRFLLHVLVQDLKQLVSFSRHLKLQGPGVIVFARLGLRLQESPLLEPHALVQALLWFLLSFSRTQSQLLAQLTRALV